MAENSLDDFFAKKDKTKKKTKSKVKPEDILAQQEQQENAKKSKKKKGKSKQNENQDETDKKDEKEDEEWKDFEEVDKVDYTGLRIKELQIKKDEESQEEDNGSVEEGEGHDRKEGGPWNKAEQQNTNPVSDVRQAPEPAPKQTAPASVSGGKYIPPSKRGLVGIDSTPSPNVSAQQRRRAKKEAPNIQSEHDFPTLGGPDYSQGGQFEEVRTGGRLTEDPSKKNLDLQLDNKFGALEGEDT